VIVLRGDEDESAHHRSSHPEHQESCQALFDQRGESCLAHGAFFMLGLDVAVLVDAAGGGVWGHSGGRGPVMRNRGPGWHDTHERVLEISRAVSKADRSREKDRATHRRAADRQPQAPTVLH
jgi:hypothetical protein